MTPEQRKEAEEKRKAEVDMLCGRLEEGLRNLRSSDVYREYLSTMSRFHNYSYRNTLLIIDQMPEASLVAPYTAWKKIGRYVRKGEHGIRILAPIIYPTRRNVPDQDPKTGNLDRGSDGTAAPEDKEVRIAGFRPVSVFDISQTEGRELPDVINELKGDLDGYDRLYDAIVEAAGVRIARGPMPGTACGMCDTRLGVISLRDDLSQKQAIKTLIHEVAHYRLHPPGIVEHRAMREVQAESVAFVVSAHFGLDTSDYTLGYLDGWMGDASDAELKSSLDIISRSASTLIGEVEQILSREKDRTKEQAEPEKKAAAPDLGEER